MRCPHCDKTIANNDNFCRYCGKAISVQDRRKVLVPPAEPGRVMIPIDKSDFGPGEIVATFESQTGTGWGAHIYTGSSSDGDSLDERPAGCPEWVEQKDWSQWFRRGLAVWDHGTHQIGTLLAGEALELLVRLRSQDIWKSEGIAIIERHENLLILDQPTRRKPRKKGKEPEASPAPRPASQPKHYEKERVRLTGRAAEEFVTYLGAHEPLLRKLADEEAALRFQASLHMMKVFAQVMNRGEFQKFDPNSRVLTWTRHERPEAFVCDVPPDRGTITLSSDGLWWLPVIERPEYAKHGWERFISLEKAMDWVEKTIPELRADAAKRAEEWEREKAEEKARLAALPRMDLRPYRIEPAALDPERITYRAIIELEYEPYSCKKTEISFGQYRRSDEEFYTPTMIARELRLIPTRVEVKQPSKYEGLYVVRSVTTYYDSAQATAQAQQTWEHSAVLDRHKEQQVVRARYGFEEVETGYCVWLGGIDSPAEPWPTAPLRADYLTQLATEQTLLYALDVNAYREFTRAPSRYISDAKLLKIMHSERAESAFLPAEVRAASRQWLNEHPDES